MLFQRGTLTERVKNAVHDLVRSDYTPGTRALRLGQRLVAAAGLEEQLRLGRYMFVDMTAPPKPLGGFKDMIIRQAVAEDVDALATIDDTPISEVRRRLDRGDLAYVGRTSERVLCKTWFYRGPAPFDDYAAEFGAWMLPPGGFWSYNAAAAPEALATGAFVKMFVTALRNLFEAERAQHILGTIRDTNMPSRRLHERLGFVERGTLITVVVPGAKWLHWASDTGRRQWLVPAGRRVELPAPPT